MKKITLLAIAITAIGFTSCKKDRTCTCTEISNGQTGTYSYTIKEESKKTAKDVCTKITTTETSGNTVTTSSTDCKLS
jgi:hypothetical protein